MTIGYESVIICMYAEQNWEIMKDRNRRGAGWEIILIPVIADLREL